jgi:inosine-uridine nucleoside N-ribohydrolase
MCILQTYSLGSKIPVIIDTDVGTDIDDTWAVSYLLQQSQVEINLILTATHNTLARTKYLAKFLTLAGRSDIPIGIGVQTDNSTGPISGALYPWAQDFDLNSYSGPLYKNGVNQMIKIIENAVQKVVIVAIAPYTNLQTALQRRPSIVNNVLIVAMGGSFFVGYNGRPPPVPEYNIR